MIEEARRSFDRQGFMKTLGAQIVSIEKGMVRISCERKESLTQQHGFFHAGVITSIADVACGYAALTTMPKGSDVLSVEFKTNLIRAAKADKIIARGKVIKTGRTLVFCEAKITDEKEEIIFATLQGTMICIQSKPIDL
ncbi:MAG: hotdog fold thioesterase [Flavobacteriaceae bacterium]|nr:MAG: hotdog fold thioesterase [Flavobacteriaceae bacterium]